jgi:guanine nucleotide-binding protein alpha-1 subunit
MMEVLQEEYESESRDDNRPSNPPSFLRDFRRIRLGFSPLFLIESNLLKLLAPGCSDSRDIVIRAGNGWKTLVRENQEGSLERGQNDPTSVLAAQKDDIIGLWTNPGVQAILERRRPKFEHSSGLLSQFFFLINAFG